MSIADGIVINNPSNFSTFEPQIINGPPLSSMNTAAYNGQIWIVGGVSTAQSTTIKSYDDILSTSFQDSLYYFLQAKKYKLSISEHQRALFNFPNASYIQAQIDYINEQYQLNYDAYLASTKDCQVKYQLHKANGDIAIDLNYQTSHTLAVSVDGYTWNRVDQNPFALISYEINAPQTLETLSEVNGLAWNGSIWLAIGDGGGTANQTAVLNTAADPDNPTIPASNYNATNQLATSPDGINWTVRGRPGRMFSGFAGATYGGGKPYGVAASSSLFVVVCGNLSGIHNRGLTSGNGTIYDPFYDDVPTICKSTDGINWSKVGNSGDYLTETSNWVGYNAVGGLFQGYGVAYNGAYWVAVGAGLPDAGSSFLNNLTGSLRSCIVVSSDNGATWVQGLDNYAGPNPDNIYLKTYYNVFSVAWNGSYWLAVGQIADKDHYIPLILDGEAPAKYHWAGDGKGVIIKSTNSLDWTVATGYPVFTTVAWDGNFWIASGEIAINYNLPGTPVMGITQRSRDGVTWETLALSGNAIVTKIPLPILGGSVNTVSSLIVGFGTPMSILRSFDDVTWYSQLTDGYGNNFSGSIQKEFHGVVWTGSDWIVVGKPQYGRYGQSILTSPDGLTWTYPTNTLEDGRGIAWNGSMAIAVGVGTDTQILSSTDLSTWTSHATDNLAECNCVAWNGTMWVIGGKGGINFSTDGITWLRSTKCSLDTVYGVAWNGSNWLACGYGTTTTILFSVNGMHWYDVKNDPFDSDCDQVAWNGAMWVAVGRSKNTIATSFDGYNWVGQGNSIFSKEGTSISWSGTSWIATGTGYGTFLIASSTDATTWTPFTIQLTRGNAYANKTIALPYTEYNPSEETDGLLADAVDIITDLTDIDVAAEAAALTIFQNSVAAAAAAAAELAARNTTKESADTYQTRLLYWQTTINEQYTPLLNNTIVDLSNTATTEFLDVTGVYNVINENVRIMVTYYNFIYDDINTQSSIDKTLNLLIDLSTDIESKLLTFYNILRDLYIQLIVANLDSRNISGTTDMIENWGFPTTTKNVVLTAYNNGVTIYNSAHADALDLFNTDVTSVTYTDPSSSNAPNFSEALATLETAANTVIVMTKIFNFAFPYKQQADAHYNRAISNATAWANITDETPNINAITAAFAPYYKSYFYSPSYETEDNPPETPPTIYILDIGQTFNIYDYGGTNIIQHTINRPLIGVKYFKTIADDYSNPGAYPSVLTTLYNQMKAKFDEVNAVKQTAINYILNLKATTIKNKLDDFKSITRTSYNDSLTIDTLLNNILSTNVYSDSPYEKTTRLALIAKAGSLLYPEMFPLIRAVHMADTDAEADGCLPPLRGWGSISNGIPLSELGTQGISGWTKYNNTYWTRNALSAFIGRNTVNNVVFNSGATNVSMFFGNYYTLYNKVLTWVDFSSFTNTGTYETMTADYTSFKNAITQFENNSYFSTATADTYASVDVAAIESKYVSAATTYLQSVFSKVVANVPSSQDLSDFGYLPFTTGTVTNISLTNYGQGYLLTPTVSFSGGGGTGAAATAVVRTEVLGITLVSPGSGYTTAPTVNIIGGSGNGATAVATISSGSVNALAMQTPGSGYFPGASVTFTHNGITDAAGFATILNGNLTKITLTSPGSGYTGIPTINITGSCRTVAIAEATINNGQIASITIKDQGSGYTNVPIITFTIGSRTSATATCSVPRSLLRIDITNAGSGYTTQPSVRVIPNTTDNSGSGALAIATVSISSSGNTFADVAATVTTDYTLLQNLANASMTSYTHTQLNTALTSAEGYASTIAAIQGSARYNEIITGIPIYKTVRANADAYKTLLETRYNRWINLKSQAFVKRIFGLGNKSTGTGSDSIMSIPPSNSTYWKPIRYSIFNNLDTQDYEECYYNVGNNTIMALPAFNTTGPAGIYRGNAVYYSSITFSSSSAPTQGTINYSSSNFTTNGNLYLSKTGGEELNAYRQDLTSFLPTLFASSFSVKGYLRIYSITSTANYAILQIDSGQNITNGVSLACTIIENVGTISGAVYVMFSPDVSTFTNIYFKPDYPVYSSSRKYTKGARVANTNGDIYQCILDNTNTLTIGIIAEPPPLYPEKWKKRTYPYVIYNETKVEGSPANLTYLQRKNLIKYDNFTKYSQGDYVYEPSDDVYYYYCMDDVETLKYITQINPTNQNFWTKRTYATGYINGIYVELNPDNFSALDSTSVPEYSTTETYNNQDYVSYSGAVFRLNIESGTTQQGKGPPGLSNGWVLNITRAPPYSSSAVYNNLDYVLYNGTIFRLNIASEETQTGLPPPTSNSKWIFNNTKAPLYSDSVTYNNLDRVLYNGDIYKSTSTQTGNIPTNTGWILDTTWIPAYSNTTVYNNEDYVLYGGNVFQSFIQAGTTQTNNTPPLINGWIADTTYVPSFSYTNVYKNQDYVLYNATVFQLNIPVGNTITGLAPPTASNNWILDPSKVPAFSNTVVYRREDYVSFSGSVYFLDVPIGITQQGLAPNVNASWKLTTRKRAYINSSYSFVEITSANFPPLNPGSFSQYVDTFERPVTVVIAGSVYTSQVINETVPKTYTNNNFVSYNDGTGTYVYECIYGSGSIIGVGTNNTYYWKKVQYPVVFYNGKFIEAFPGNIPPYEYTPDYPKSNGRPLSDSSDFQTYSDQAIYNKGDLISYSPNETPSSATLVAILQDLSYSGASLTGLGFNALIQILQSFAPGYYERLTFKAFYECVDDSTTVVPIQNVPLSNTTNWERINYPYINTDLDGTIEADPANGTFILANDIDYHEYDNNWIYREGDVTSYNGLVYECINTTPPDITKTIIGVSPLTSTGYWKDVSYSGVDYDNFVEPVYSTNNISQWSAFVSTRSYARGMMVEWDGDIYVCETTVTYQATYNLLIPADVLALRNSIPPLNPTVWKLLTDYTTLVLPIPNKYNPSSTYIAGDIVTLKTVADPIGTAASTAIAFYGVDVYHLLTFYRCVSTDPSYPVKYKYDSFYTLDEYTTGADGTDNYKLGIAYGNNQDYNVPRYIEADDDPFALDGFLVELRRKVILFVELPYKYIKTHIEAARRGDLLNFTTLIGGATRVKYNYGSLAVKPINAASEFITLQSSIATIISNFDASETPNGTNPANCSIDDVFTNAYSAVKIQLKQCRDDMIYYVSQVNKMKTQYFNLPSVQANIFKDPYKYLNPVALATNTTSPGQVKVMFRDLGIGNIDEITYNLDVLHNGILSSEAERTYYNENVVIMSGYINRINNHVQFAKNLIGFSLITAAHMSLTKSGVRIKCIVANVDNVSPINIDTPISDYNGIDNYTEQRNFNDRVINNYNILGTITFQELQALVEYNVNGDAYYVRNFAIDYDALSTQDKQKYNDSDRHLYVYKPDATRNVVGWDQGGWVDQGRFDDPGDSLTLTGLVNAMVLGSIVPPNYTLPTSRESATALTLTYESQNSGMRGLTVFTNGVVGTFAAAFQNIWDPMAILGLVNAISGEQLLEGGGLTFPNFNSRIESINLLNQLVSIERKKIKSVQSGVLNYGIQSGNTTSFILGIGQLKRGITYNFALFNAEGAQQSGLTVQYIDRVNFLIGYTNSTTVSSGRISFSAGTLASGTIVLSIYDQLGNDVSTLLSTFYSSLATIKGYITIYSTLDPDSNFSLFSITAGSVTGTGSTSAISLTCTFIKSLGTISSVASVGVAFSKTLPDTKILYSSQVSVTQSNAIVIPVSSGTGTGSVVGIKVTTGNKSDGQYSLRYKKSTDQDRDYLNLSPNLAYDATHGGGWSMLTYAATTALQLEDTTVQSGTHTVSEIDDAIITVGKLLILCSANRKEIINTIKQVPVLVRSVKTNTYELPPVSDPPIGTRPPDFIPPTYEPPTLELRASIQHVIDKLGRERSELKMLLRKLQGEKAALQGLPIAINSVNVNIPEATYTIQKPITVEVPPPRPGSDALHEIDKSKYRTLFPGDADGLRRLDRQRAEAKAKFRAWEVKFPQGLDPPVLEKVAPVQNNIEAVNAAKLKRAALKLEAKQALLDAQKLKAQRITENAISIDMAKSEINKLTVELDNALLEEANIRIENSAKTLEFKNAQAEYRANLVAADKAVDQRALAQSDYDKAQAEYARTTNARDAAVARAKLQSAQSKLGTAISEEISASGQLKISYEVYQTEFAASPAVRVGIKSQLYTLFQTIVDFTFEDLFDLTKSLVQSALAQTLRRAIRGIIACHISYSDLKIYKARLGNTRIESALVSRVTSMAKAIGLPLARAASAAAGTTLGRKIMRAPILGVAGAGAEIYGAFVTASANGAYESSPAILNY